jgi:8-oxo-dGTP diphosphatase
VNVGETLEETVTREVKEETNLGLVSLEQFKIYSDPNRDKRRHTVSAVFRCIATDSKDLKKGDDAKYVAVVPLRDVLKLPLAFDPYPLTLTL